MSVRRGGALLLSAPISVALLSAPTGCSALGGEDCDSYRQTQYIPAQSILVF